MQLYNAIWSGIDDCYVLLLKSDNVRIMKADSRYYHEPSILALSFLSKGLIIGMPVFGQARWSDFGLSGGWGLGKTTVSMIFIRKRFALQTALRLTLLRKIYRNYP